MARLKQETHIHSKRLIFKFINLCHLRNWSIIQVRLQNLISVEPSKLLSIVEHSNSFKYDTSATNILIIRTMTAHNPKLYLFNKKISKVHGNGWIQDSRASFRSSNWIVTIFTEDTKSIRHKNVRITEGFSTTRFSMARIKNRTMELWIKCVLDIPCQ